MGLDQYLFARKYISGIDWDSPEKPNAEYTELIERYNAQDFAENYMASAEVSIRVAYWRKANQIHGWLVDNVQRGLDNCGEYWVSREKLGELLELCKSVVADHSKAQELLPPREGFFFGGDGIDEWYFSELESTIQTLERVISNTPDEWEFYYSSSW